MATHTTLTSLFSDIADAIREKTGDTGDIVADEFPTEIANIPSGGDVSDYFYNTVESVAGYAVIKRIPPFTLVSNRANYMFENWSSLIEVGTITTTTMSILSTQRMFNGCTALTTAPYFDTSRVNHMGQMFSNCSSLHTVPNYDTSSVTNMGDMFNGCEQLETIPNFNTANNIYFSNFFTKCLNINNIPLLDCTSCTSVYHMFSTLRTSDYFTKLTNCAGFKDLGKAYETTRSANYSSYTLDMTQCTALTEQSIINILTNLYDIASKGVATQSCILGATNLAKLTSAEGQQALADAQTKGWTVS